MEKQSLDVNNRNNRNGEMEKQSSTLQGNKNEICRWQIYTHKAHFWVPVDGKWYARMSKPYLWWDRLGSITQGRKNIPGLTQTVALRGLHDLHWKNPPSWFMLTGCSPTSTIQDLYLEFWAKIPALLSRMQWPISMLCSATADYFWWYKSTSKCMAQAVRHTAPCTLHMVVDGPRQPSCDKKGGNLPGRKHPGLMLCLDSTLLICWSVTDEKPEAHYHGDTYW